QRDHGAEGEEPPVEPDAIPSSNEALDVRGHPRSEHPDAHLAQREADQTRSDGEEEPLGQELDDDPRPRCAERDPERELHGTHPNEPWPGPAARWPRWRRRGGGSSRPPRP